MARGGVGRRGGPGVLAFTALVGGVVALAGGANDSAWAQSVVAPAIAPPDAPAARIADGNGGPSALAAADAPPAVRVATVAALQGFAAQNKVMPGLALRLGRRWGIRVETSFIWTTDPAAGLGSFLGNQLGLYVEATPLRRPRFDATMGAGVDAYFLWGIHHNLTEAALSVEANAAYWVRPSWGVVLGLRGYLLQKRGLELGTRRDGSAGNPILLTAGVAVRSL